MLRFYSIFLFFILTLQAAIFPQTFPIENYLETHGLPSPIVRCIIQDAKGYLWLGTRNGLSRFDGTEFENFFKSDGLTNDGITALMEDSSGQIWIGTERGVVKYNKDSGSIESFKKDFPPGSTFYAIVEDVEGNIWFGASKGLYLLSHTGFKHIPPENSQEVYSIYSIAIEDRQHIWLGTQYGLRCVENGKIVDCSKNFNGPNLLHHPVSCLLIDSKGVLWIGTKYGLNCLKDGQLTAITKKDGLCHDYVTAILEDRAGNMWIGTWDGVSVFTVDGMQPIRIVTQNGIPDNFIYSIIQDYEGNIWLGTHGGASCLTSLTVKSYSMKDGLPNNIVTSIGQDKKDRFWFGTSGGLGCYQKGSFKTYTIDNGLAGNAVNNLLVDHLGNIWCATTQGLSIYSNGKFKNYTKEDGLFSNILICLTQRKDGTIWIGHSGGFTCWNKGKFSPPPFDFEITPIVFAMEDKAGKLWFCSRSKLFCYDDRQLTSFTSKDGIMEFNINNIYQDSKGKLWVATDGGLFKYDGKRFTHSSTKNTNLINDKCYIIVEDADNRLWIGHSKGFTSFDGTHFNTFSNKRLGLSSRSWLTGIKDNRGRMWFGSTEGVTQFVSSPVTPVTSPPPVYITGVKVMEEDVPLTGTNRFGYDRNIFRFTFAGLSFTASSEIQYKYRLEKIDKEWQTTKERSLFYPFLPPGAYNLQVKAINADGIESTTAAEYRFKIRPPFWQTWWFILGSVFVAGILLLYGIQARVKRVRDKAELRAKNRQLVTSQRMELMGTLAAGTVHDLKNLLAVIVDYSREISQEYESDDENYRNVKIIKDTAATAVQMSKQILSFARPKHHDNEPVELATVLSEILETLKVMQPVNIRMHWQPPSEAIFFHIHPGRFQQLVMNLCINAFQAMPEGGQLDIFLCLDESNPNEVILKISDTGPTGIAEENLDKIFNPLFTTKEEGKGTGLGLFVVKQIVDQYNGHIDVESQAGTGTTFTIRFILNV